MSRRSLLHSALRCDIRSGVNASYRDYELTHDLYVIHNTVYKWSKGFAFSAIHTFTSNEPLDQLEEYCDLLASFSVNTTILRYRVFALRSLESSLFKKFTDDANTAMADEKAIKLFLDMNQRCLTKRDTSALLYQPVRDLVIHNLRLWLTRPAITERGLTSSIGDGALPFDLDKIAELGRFGPGASRATRATAFAEKLSSDLSCTSDWIANWYLRTCWGNPTCKKAELQRLLKAGYVLTAGSKVSCVPKSSEISRIICTEPALNMFFQLGLGRMMEIILQKRLGIDLAIQPTLNRNLAKLGSRSGEYATIDLRSASDTISLDLVKELLAGTDVLALMLDLRCEQCELPDGRTVQLNMLSTMGNGFTFPFQTMLFAAVVVSVYQLLGIKPVNGRNYGVFGDDIIVTKASYPLVCSMLNAFGFIVNHDKSFATGSFRESCGGDYYNGYHVRGVYCKTLVGQHNLYSLYNRLVWWSAKHLPLESTILQLYSFIKQSDVLYVPAHEDVTSGIQTPEPRGSVANIHGVHRYRRLRHIPQMRKARFSPYIHLKGMLHGSIENDRYTVRSRTGRYRVGYASTSQWSHIPRGACLYEASRRSWSIVSQYYLDLLLNDVNSPEGGL